MLDTLKRTLEVKFYEKPKLLFPEEFDLKYTNDDSIKTIGLGKLDAKQKDLLHIIEIEDALSMKFKYLNLFSPRTFAESLESIAPHCTVQGIIISRVTKNTKDIIYDLEENYKYNKHDEDSLWVGDKGINELNEGDTLMIMNRRVGGWDGSLTRPVIELLGAGGHIPTLVKGERFYTLTPEETIKKEVEEEIGLFIKNDNLLQIGGFHNKVSNELVILYGIFIEDEELMSIQKNAYNNIEENTDGIYIGEINSVMNKYLTNAEPFAGGENAKPTNFPSNNALMKKIMQL